MNSIFSGSPILRRLTVLFCAALVLASAAGPAIQPAMAWRSSAGYGPQSYKSDYTYGNGVYFAPYRFTVYTEPREDAPTVAEFRWSRSTAANTMTAVTSDGEQHAVYADRLFFCFYPELDVAMMAVTGDDENGWLEVIYDQGKKKTGWVRAQDLTANKPATGTAATDKQSLPPLDKGTPQHFGVYQTWQEFMKLNAKASGVYWLSGVSEYNRSIRQSDADDAKFIPITIMRELKVRHIRGNWMLVEVLDFERNTPIGWVRWRDDDGHLMVFPNLSGEHLPIVTTAY